MPQKHKLTFPKILEKRSVCDLPPFFVPHFRLEFVQYEVGGFYRSGLNRIFCRAKTFWDILQISGFTRNCDTVIWYHKNYTLFLSWNTLPKPQVQAPQFQLHISYFLQNCKKGKPSKKDLPYLKTISQVLNPLSKLRIHSRTHKFS